MKKYRKPYREKTKLQYSVKFITDLLVMICLAYFLVITFGERYYIIGNSMSEKLNDNEVVLIDKAIYEFTEPERFDVIIFRPEGVNAAKTYVKRIIALPGETVQIKNGSVLVNGMELLYDVTDSQILTPGLASEKILLGDDEYFVLGDNRNNSEDSRFYTIGNIKRSNIIGKAWLKVYPLSTFGVVE